MTIRFFLLSFLLVLNASARDAVYWPGGDWERTTPKEARADPDKLQKALDYAGSKSSNGVVVVYRGKILAEQYWNGWDKSSTGPIYSATKSLVSSLVGMTIEDGKIKSDKQKSSDFLSEWEGKKQYENMRIEHHLSMTPGLRSNMRIFLLGLVAKDERKFATRLPADHEPGTQWAYHNSGYRLLFPILEEATGESLAKYAQRKIFDPLEMKTAKWRQKKRSDDYSFMEMSARDAARYGLFILRQGNWKGKQLLSREYIQKATRPYDKKVHSSYGYLWWLNGGESHYLPLKPEKRPGMIFPGCPADAFAALGKDDQKIYIVPSLQLVVTRLGGAADNTSPALSGFDSKFLGAICGSLAK